MPIYEFKCPEHGVFERIVALGQKWVMCGKPHRRGSNTLICNKLCERVEQERPAWRNPRYGEG
jgi:hypothetical protein